MKTPTCRIKFNPYMKNGKLINEQNNWNRFRNN